ncbi:MAG: NAD(P)-dependent oxidoreductase [Gammaproteobacteria bacterium]|tara:strand:- start:69 stop:944 length:876 start_codon:yes stop_codon:yes gene_type:complete
MKKALGFIGLGVMGFPMAGYLANQNNNISVFNRTAKKSEAWIKKYNGTICNSPAEVAKLSDVIMICIGDDNDVRNVIAGENGMIDNLKPESIIVDHTTTSADLSKEMNKLLNPKDVFYIDAPVSGGEAGAQSGQLSIMAGGNKESYDLIKIILEPYTKFIKYMGPSGSGQLTKMVNQICIAGLIQAIAEGINFAKEVGLQPEDVLEVVSKGAAQSWQMENRWETMTQNKYDYGFAVDLMRKDLEILLKEAKKSNVNLDITETINEFYKDIQKAGGGRWDTSSLLKRLEELS